MSVRIGFCPLPTYKRKTSVAFSFAVSIFVLLFAVCSRPSESDDPEEEEVAADIDNAVRRKGAPPSPPVGDEAARGLLSRKKLAVADSQKPRLPHDQVPIGMDAVKPTNLTPPDQMRRPASANNLSKDRGAKKFGGKGVVTRKSLNPFRVSNKNRCSFKPGLRTLRLVQTCSVCVHVCAGPELETKKQAETGSVPPSGENQVHACTPATSGVVGESTQSSPTQQNEASGRVNTRTRTRTSSCSCSCPCCDANDPDGQSVQFEDI